MKDIGARLVAVGLMLLSLPAHAQRLARDSASALAARADTLNRAGSLEERRRAIALRREAADLYIRVGDSLRAAESHARIGMAYSGLRNADSALAAFRESLALGA